MKAWDRRDVPRVFSQRVKENKCNVPSVPGFFPGLPAINTPGHPPSQPKLTYHPRLFAFHKVCQCVTPQIDIECVCYTAEPQSDFASAYGN
jgi:hypothetical protein